jgi:dsRNA-specific ribonuclease
MLRPPSVEVDGLPRLITFKYPRTEDQVFTHRSYFSRRKTVFEDPSNDPAPDNEVLQYIGDSVLSMAVGLLTKKTYRTYARP